MPDHWVGVFRCEGIHSITGGEAGVLVFQGTADLIAGGGPQQGYFAIIYDDGSTVRGKWEQTVTPGKSFTAQGTLQHTAGTGRFTGIKGGGRHTIKSYAGRRYIEWTETYTLPSQ